MFCTECGCKLEDKMKFCPSCGTKVMGLDKDLFQGYVKVNNPQRDGYLELEQIAMEVYRLCPNDQYKGIAIFRERTSLDLKTARNIMFREYHGAYPEELDRRKKAFKSEKARRIFGTSNCPKCGSKYLEKTHLKSASITSKVSLFGERYMTDHVDAEDKLHCLYCGYTWNPYKKK